MGNFQKGDRGGFRGGNKFGGKPGFPKKSWGADKPRFGERTMHKAVCSKCGNSCEVPFLPSNDKPVYCSNCFVKKDEGDSRPPRRDFGDRGPRRDFNDRPAPRNDFRPASTGGDDLIKKQLSELNTKIDKLIGLMEKNVSPKTEVASVKEISTISPKKKAIEKKIAKKK